MIALFRTPIGMFKPLLLFPLALVFAMLLTACSSEEPEPIVSALHFFERANKALDDENYDAAILNYRKAIALEERVPDFHYNLGIALFAVEAWEEAVVAFDHTLLLKPKFADAHLNLALTYDRLYKRQHAHEHFNRYQELTVGAPLDSATSDAVAAAPASAKGGSGLAGGATLASTGAADNEPDENKPKPEPPVRPARRLPAQPSQPTGDTGKWWTQDRFLPSP